MGTDKILCVVAAASAVVFAGCSGREKRMAEGEVSNYVVEQTIKTAARSYRMVPDDDLKLMGGYASLGVSVQWPEKMGDHSLKTLQDSIVAKTFGAVAPGKRIDALMARFVNDTDCFEAEGARFEPVDSVPSQEAEGALTVQLTARVAECSEQFVTYQIINSSYLGGAHPYTGITYFTYDLDKATVLTAANMFVPGSGSAVLAVVKDALAQKFDTTPDRLDDVGLFASQITWPGEPYLIDGAVAFHYNPYEIAPYAMGQIDVSVDPSDIEEYLTPEVKTLIFGY